MKEEKIVSKIENDDHCKLGTELVEVVNDVSLRKIKNANSNIRQTIVFDLFIYCFSRLYLFLDEKNLYTSDKYIEVSNEKLKKELNIQNFRTNDFVKIIESLREDYFKLNLKFNMYGKEVTLIDSAFSFQIISKENTIDSIRIFLGSAFSNSINNSDELREKIETPRQYINLFVSNIVRLERKNAKLRIFYEIMQKWVKKGELYMKIVTLKNLLGYSSSTNKSFVIKQLDSFIEEFKEKKIYTIIEYKKMKSNPKSKYDDFILIKFKPYIDIEKKSIEILDFYIKNIYISRCINKKEKKKVLEVLMLTLSSSPNDETISLLKTFKKHIKKEILTPLSFELINFIERNLGLEIELNNRIKTASNTSNFDSKSFLETERTIDLQKEEEGEIKGVKNPIKDKEKYKLIEMLFPNNFSIDQKGVEEFNLLFKDRDFNLKLEEVEEIKGIKKIEESIEFIEIYQEIKEKGFLESKDKFDLIKEYLSEILKKEIKKEILEKIEEIEFKKKD